MENKKTVCQKLQIVRDKLNNTKMEKTGFNGYSQYKYYQTADFMPYVQRYCNEEGICPLLSFDKEKNEAVMIVMNSENMGETLEFRCAYTVPQLKGSNTAQMVGGMITFFTRYMYMLVFAITENDTFDSLSPEQNQEVEQVKQDDDKKEKLIKEIIKNKENKELQVVLKNELKETGAKSIKELPLESLVKIYKEVIK